MKPYAERLAKAAPERFGFERRYASSCIVDRSGAMDTFFLGDGHFAVAESKWWELWGPLAEERGIERVDRYARDPMGFRQEAEDGSELPPKFLTLLEAIADAVCRSFEEAAQGKEA